MGMRAVRQATRNTEDQMTYEITTPPAFFVPKTITITFESQREIDAFCSVCNMAQLKDACELVVGTRGLPSFHVVEQLGGNNSHASAITDYIRRK